MDKGRPPERYAGDWVDELAQFGRCNIQNNNMKMMAVDKETIARFIESLCMCDRPNWVTRYRPNARTHDRPI